MEQPQQSHPERRLKVDLAMLDVAFEDASWEFSYYLDTETGEVEVITEDIRRALRGSGRVVEECGEEGDTAFADALRRQDFPAWLRDAVEAAYHVDAELGGRYIAVPEADSREGYRDMEDFIDNLENERLRGLLEGAIRGSGAFRRFKDRLARHPDDWERWHAFKNSRVRQRVLDWLEEEGIRPVSE